MKRLVSRSLISTVVGLAGIALVPATLAQDKATPAPKVVEGKPLKATEPETKVKAKKLTVGDDAPALKVEKFIKGDEIKKFEKGHVYVVEFWATWCGPCIAGMPHLSEVQEKFKDKKVHVIGVNVWEKPYSADTQDKVSKFVDGKGDTMKYTVAYDGETMAMDKAYMAAAGKNGIPCAFVVNGDGKIAYIGHPGVPAFEDTIQQVVDGKFDMKGAAEKAAKSGENEQKTAALHKKISELMQAEKWEEAFVEMDKLVAIDPEMVVQVGMTKFNHYMDAKKPAEAYKVATDLIEGKGKDNAQLLNAIAWTIVDPDKGVEKPNLEVAMKAAARAAEVTKNNDAAILDTLARVYWLKKDKAKALETQTKAVSICKDAQMKSDLEKTLEEYKGEKDEMDKK